MTGLSRVAVLRLMDDGTLHTVKIGNRRLILAQQPHMPSIWPLDSPWPEGTRDQTRPHKISARLNLTGETSPRRRRLPPFAISICRASPKASHIAQMKAERELAAVRKLTVNSPIQAKSGKPAAALAQPLFEAGDFFKRH